MPIVLSNDLNVSEVIELSRILVEKNEYLTSREGTITDEVSKVKLEVKSLTKKLDNLIYGLYYLTANEVSMIEEFLDGKLS